MSKATWALMQLKEAQTVLSTLNNQPQTAQEAMRELRAATQRAMDYWDQQHTVMAQLYLEHCFTLLMLSFHYLNISAEQAVKRECQRGKGSLNDQPDRVILIFADHAELRVDNELKGSFPLYSEQDYAQLQEIAQLFNCRMEYTDHVQLNLLEQLRPIAHSAPD